MMASEKGVRDGDRVPEVEDGAAWVGGLLVGGEEPLVRHSAEVR